MLPEEIKHKLAPLCRLGWQPKVGPAVAGARSKFGGQPLLKSGEVWPRCGHCHEPMQLFVQLDSQDLPHGAGMPFGDGVLQVFYCTNADEECDVFERSDLPFSDATLCRVIPRAQANGFEAPLATIMDAFPEQAVTGWQGQLDYPSRDEWQWLSLSPTQRDMLQCLQQAPAAGDKMLGWPCWVKGSRYPLCPCCDNPMHFIMQLDSIATLPFMFGNNGCAYITQCQRHPQVVALNWSSR